MNKLNKLITIVVLIFSVSVSSFANFNDGFAAYQKGDYKTALNKWRPLAEQGKASAQFIIGVMYFEGKGVLQDYKESVKWYRKAAEQGHPGGQLYLGNMYTNGDGVLKDYKESVRLYTKAAEQGMAEAELKLGLAYILGVGVLKDLSKAKYWIKKAYENPTISTTTKEDVEKAWNDFELWKY
jgi:TPR repeat protein